MEQVDLQELYYITIQNTRIGRKKTRKCMRETEKNSNLPEEQKLEPGLRDESDKEFALRDRKL